MKLAIVVPCYNEEEVLTETSRRLEAVLERMIGCGQISDTSTICLVDDGSKDRTWSVIEELSAVSRRIVGIKLSRNQGHQRALLAGLDNVDADAVVTIDADLQDDPASIEQMVDKCKAGADIVYGVRKDREVDSSFKRFTAESFYKLMRALGAETVHNHADYRLMTRRAIECLQQFREVNLYLRGIVPLVGFKTECVYYSRGARIAGTPKYSVRMMLALALDAATSFSVIPLRFVAVLGATIFFGSMLVTIWALWARVFTDYTVPGWTSTVLPMYFLGGIQILCIGILGEYMGRIYAEVKSRPRYFVEKTVAHPTVGVGL